MNQMFKRYISTISRSSKATHYVGSQSATVFKKRSSQTIPLPVRFPSEAKEFSWGQSTAGAFWLALCLLRDVTTQKRAIAAHKAFCDEVISRLGSTWTLTAQDIKYWLKIWEEEQQHLASLEAAKPKAAAPRSLPFYGVVEAALVSCAYDRIKEFVQLAPANQRSSTAMMYLELAVNLSEVRRKTVNTIHWSNADAAARGEVWLQLLMMEQQIGFNLKRFGQWWDSYVEEIPPDFCFPTPYYLADQPAALVNHQANRKIEIRSSINYLSKFAQEIQQRGDRYEPFLLKQLAGRRDA